MALYAVGDVQGCFQALRRLLDRINFDPSEDQLWFTGDLVNRGPESAAVLRFVQRLDDRASVVLGNHDLNLLAVAAGVRRVSRSDTFHDVLTADDRDELLAWLCRRPLLVRDADLGVAMVHAGIVPAWTWQQAHDLAREVEAAVRGEQRVAFLANMFGDRPDTWDASLDGWQRLRFVTNVMTRMRYCDDRGRVDLNYTGPPGTQPAHLRPWFAGPRATAGTLVVFGHWSSLGVRRVGDAVCLDSGCVWGRRLSVVRLVPAPLAYFSVSCAGHGGATIADIGRGKTG